MTCNTASTANEGFSFEGWQPGVYWRGNKMDNLARGMILKNGGVIGQQGWQSGTASDNEWLGSAWTGTNYGIYTSASQATNSPIVKQSSGQLDPPNLDGDPNDPAGWKYSGVNGLIAYTGSTFYSCAGSYTQMPSIIFPHEEDYESENLLYMARTALYRSLHYNTEYPDDDGIYADYRSLFDGSAMETLADIALLITNNNLADAAEQLALLDPEDLNFIENNYYSFYELFVNYSLSGELDATETAALNYLCGLCPATDGESIYQARALYLLVNGEPYEASPCTDEGARKVTLPNGSLLEDKGNLKVIIHPNPSSESVNIKLNKKVNGLQVIVDDIGGRTILKKDCLGQASSFYFPYDLEPGIYFFKIINGQENVTKKVVVAR
jgi:hypothetical protein